jgi:hypothetical protein
MYHLGRDFFGFARSLESTLGQIEDAFLTRQGAAIDAAR